MNFAPYFKITLTRVRGNWYKLLPPEAREPMLKQGKVTIEFKILKGGDVDDLKIVDTSGDDQLDGAARGSVLRSTPMLPLPSEYKDKFLGIRITFCYNPGSDSRLASKTSNAERRPSTTPESPNVFSVLSLELEELKEENIGTSAESEIIPPHIYSVGSYGMVASRDPIGHGTLSLWLTVTKEGSCKDGKIEKSISPVIDEAAVDAISRWEFIPAMKDGKPVQVRIKVNTTFALY